MTLNREQILSAKDREIIVLDIPEWGGEVRLMAFSGGSAESISPEDSISKVVALSIIDDNGNLVFSEEDIDALKTRSARVLKRVFDEALKLNGLGDNAIEDATKN